MRNVDFSAVFFSGNRERLAAVLPDSLIVIAAHAHLQKSADMAYPFRQDSNFWYLTGVNEADVVLLINTKSGTSTLLLPDQSDYQKEWEGAFDKKTLKRVSGISDFGVRSELEAHLRAAKKQRLQVCYAEPPPERVEPYGFYANPARRVIAGEIKSVVDVPKDIRIELARLRQIKQPAELSALQRAIDITADTLADMKQRLSSFETEKDLERAITAGFFARGADGHAYEPIIAGGAHAAIIHYQENDAPLPKNELLLLDVGALVRGYAADISRTWALGTPSKRQKEIYDTVVRLQETALSMLKPGVYIREYQKSMEAHATKAIEKLGLPARPYPHGFSHFLGLDVHDAGDYDSPLLTGSVLTVEPGLYVSEEGIGVRIEDNILVTETGIEVLSKRIPRTL